MKASFQRLAVSVIVHGSLLRAKDAPWNLSTERLIIPVLSASVCRLENELIRIDQSQFLTGNLLNIRIRLRVTAEFLDILSPVVLFRDLLLQHLNLLRISIIFVHQAPAAHCKCDHHDKNNNYNKPHASPVRS